VGWGCDHKSKQSSYVAGHSTPTHSPMLQPLRSTTVFAFSAFSIHSARMNVPDPPGSARTKFNNVTMFVYGKDDIVSDNLRGPQHTWEGGVSGERGVLSVCAAIRAVCAL